MSNWYKLYLYSIFLGFRVLFKNPRKFTKEAFKRIVIPMDIARYFEIPQTYTELNPQKNEKILDLSSPKLLAFFIAEKMGNDITATDIWKDEIKNWKELENAIMGESDLRRPLILQVADGRKLKYKKNYFDKVYCISVIEHISENGDLVCMKELARVLKPGGTIVLTVPYGKKYREVWVNKNVYKNKFKGKESVFFSRTYDKKTLVKRLIKPSGLSVKKQIVCEEKLPIFSDLYVKTFPLMVIFGLLFPILAAVSLKKGREIGNKNNTLLVLTKRNPEA